MKMVFVDEGLDTTVRLGLGCPNVTERRALPFRASCYRVFVRNKTFGHTFLSGCQSRDPFFGDHNERRGEDCVASGRKS